MKYILVVGMGYMGSIHANHLRSRGDCQVVAVEPRDDFKDGPYMTYRSVSEVFADNRFLSAWGIDAICVATPIGELATVARECLEHTYGIPILVEKPGASSYSELIDLHLDFPKADIRLGYIERMNPAVTKVKDWYERGRLGDLLYITARRFGPARTKDVEIFYTALAHDLDLTHYMFGLKVVKVTDSNVRYEADHEVFRSLTLQLEDGVNASLFGGHFGYKDRKMTVVGTKGIATIDFVEQSAEFIGKDEYELVPGMKQDLVELEWDAFFKNDKRLSTLLEGFDIMSVVGRTKE